MEQSERDNKRVMHNTIFLYTRMVITAVVSLFTVRVVFKTLGVVDYGIYNAVGGIILSMTFISKVLALASQRFLSLSMGKNDDDGLKRDFCAIIIVYILLSVVIVILAESVGLWFLNTKMTIPSERMFAANVTYHLSLISFIMTILLSPYQSLVISYERMKIFAYISVLEVVLKLVIVFMLLMDFYPDRLIVYAILMLIATFFSNVVYYVYCKVHFPVMIGMLKWDWGRMKSIIGYSSWTMFGTLSGMLSNHGVGILLNMFWGPVANAAYGIATQISNQANALAYNFFMAARPSLIKSYARGDKDYTQSLFYASSKIIFVLLFLIFLPVYMMTEDLLCIWLGEVQPYMVQFVHQMLIFVLILSLSLPITAIIQAEGAVKKYHVVVDGFTLISLPLAFIVAKLGGGATTVLYVFNLIFLLAHIIRIYILHTTVSYFSFATYLKSMILPMVLVMVLAFTTTSMLKAVLSQSLLSSACVAMEAIVVTAVCSFFLLLKREERGYVVNLVKKKLVK